ncbi:hypothetical protein GUJ93_ZPchr0011g28471 [Zizania palustris]|uniref:Uncharacterized protein n=1 Tax=Zizania palustris TaxID=103762 RepID=A0A8J6BSF2_ZIZPA|nr:hypothetical protein GUJ93_ZPchr0011g28471 [Zizania palustris]
MASASHVISPTEAAVGALPAAAYPTSSTRRGSRERSTSFSAHAPHHCSPDERLAIPTKNPFPTLPLSPSSFGGGTEAAGGTSNGKLAWSSNPRPSLRLTPQSGGAVTMQRLLAGSLVALTLRLFPIADSFLRRHRPLRSPLPVL